MLYSQLKKSIFANMHHLSSRRLNYKQLLITVLLSLGSNSLTAAQSCNNAITASTPTDQFTEMNNSTTVLDNRTNLMWKRCSEGQSWVNASSSCSGTTTQYTWQGALNRAEAVNSWNNGTGFSGYNDWRLPSLKEIESIVEYQCYAPAINLTVFPNTPPYVNNHAANFWTSTPNPESGSTAWTIDFLDAATNSNYTKINSLYVRLVRDGS